MTVSVTVLVKRVAAPTMGASQVHLPALQICFELQAMLQLPQWAGSICRSKHWDPHKVWPAVVHLQE